MNEQNMISFVPLQKRHFAYLAEWMQESHVWKWWGEGRQWSLQDIERKYASYVDGYKLESGEKKPIHAFLIEYAGKPIGYIQYYSAFDFPREGYKVQDIWQGNSLAALDFFIGDMAYLGKGLGAIALRLFLEKHVYTEFSACLVDPDKENQAAINTYEKTGFKPYGELKRSIVMVGSVDL
jgi:aminoglycoside 6'-N-acetyltransferase